MKESPDRPKKVPTGNENDETPEVRFALTPPARDTHILCETLAVLFCIIILFGWFIEISTFCKLNEISKNRRSVKAKIRYSNK